MRIFFSLWIPVFCHTIINSQSILPSVSVTGNLHYTNFDLDKDGNKYFLFYVEYPDTFWINDQPRYDLLNLKKYGDFYNNLFLIKCDTKNNLINLSHIYSNLHSGIIEVDEDQSAYLTVVCNSDTLFFNDSMIINRQFKKSSVLLRLNKNLQLVDYLVFKNATELNSKIRFSNDRMFISGTFVDTFEINGLKLICYPKTSLNINSFVCSLSKNLDSIFYLVNFGGTGYDIISDIEIDKYNNLYFCGSATSKYLNIGADSFNRPDDRYSSRYIFGKIDSAGLLDWHYQTGCSKSETLNDISFSQNGDLLILGSFYTTQITIDNQVLYNPYYPKINSFISQWTRNGDFVNLKHFNQSGPIDIKEVNLDLEQNHWITLSTFDTLIDARGHEYHIEPYGNFYFCKLDNKFDIIHVNYVTSSDGFGIHGIKFDNQGHLIAKLWYKGKYLMYNDSIIIDSIQQISPLGFPTFLLVDFDQLLTNLQEYFNNSKRFLLYPNPSSGSIHIKASTGNIYFNKIILYNSKGLKLLEKDYGQNTSECNLEIPNLGMGIFIVCLFQKGNLITAQKLIINK